MDLGFISNYFVPVVMAGCLATGYVVKKWIKDVDNKWIPTVVFFEGAALNCIVSGNVTVETVVAGAVCGLASRIPLSDRTPNGLYLYPNKRQAR